MKQGKISETIGIELIPGFAISMIVAIVATLLDDAPSDEVTDIFDTAVSQSND